jgi:hypothetical protein
MNSEKQSVNLNLGWLSTFGLLILLTFTFLDPPSAIAKKPKKNAPVVLFKPPSDDPQPEKTEGAASRQNLVCSQDSLIQSKAIAERPKLTALVPQSNHGLTTAKRPTFWVYLPQTAARQAILSIKTKGSSPHWQQSIDLTRTTGTIGIKLANNAPPLEIGKNYQWALILICGDRPHPNDPVVAAEIERIDKSQIKPKMSTTVTGLEKAAWYARQGIWYDALNVLVAEKPSLNNWHDLWVRYLQTEGLEEIAHEPVVSS